MSTAPHKSERVEGRAAPALHTFEAIGALWQIETDLPLPLDLRQGIAGRIEDFDRIWSRFRPDSLVSRVACAQSGGTFRFPDEGIALFDLYDRLHEVTGGAVDPLIGRDLERLGYDAAYSLAPSSTPNTGPRLSWSEDVERNGARLSITRPLTLDFGAAGKGFLVDIIAGMLVDAGVLRCVVDAGGDMRLSGQERLRVGLEHPFAPDQVIGVAEMDEGAICASATNRRRWGHGLHHVLDARNGHPVRDVVATWVTCRDAMLADGLATALFFTGADALHDAFAFQSVRMFADGRAEMSRDFPGEIFTQSAPLPPARPDERSLP